MALTPAHRTVLRRWGAPIALPVLRLAARTRVRSAMRSAPDQALPLLRALDRHLAGRHTAAECATFARIEAVRGRLAASKVPLSVVNYGAGAPGSTKTESQMRRGRTRSTTIGAVTRTAAKQAWWAQLLAVLVADLEPSHAVELGTSVGISAAYQASALPPTGRLWTLEGAPEVANVARATMAELALPDVEVVVGRFDDTLSGVLADAGPIDHAFVDGHHDEHATLRYFEQLIPFLGRDALVVFDDISWSEGMNRAWRTIASDDRVHTAVNLRSMGIVVVGPTAERRTVLDLALR